MVAARGGDTSAMSALVGALATRLGPVCGAIALDDGDDALQEALIVVLRNLGDLREPAAVVGWARRIAVREAVRVAARRSRSVLVADVGDRPPRAPGLPGGEADVDLGLDVRATLAALAPEHRAVLALRHLEGLSEDEAAEVLRVAPGTVKSRSARAKVAFRRRWTA